MRRKAIREILDAERPLVTPLAHDALSARLIAQAGFRAFTVGGSALLAARHAYPDIGLIGLTDMVEGLRDLAAATDLPFLADADDGYGDVKAVARLVQAYERIGVGGFLLEDQDRDRKQQRADHGGAVVDLPAIEGKLRAALAVRENPNTFIIGRTDAFGALGLDEAMRRAERFLKIGCDGIFIAGLKREEDLARVGKAFKGAYLSAAMFETEGSAWLTPQELGELGYRHVSYPATLVFRAVNALAETLSSLRAASLGTGSFSRMVGAETARARLDDAVRLKDWRAHERYGLAQKEMP
ncbi:MAG: isocitrate lyase/PEP mutase family protein [Beijerinckiaceae bacterium]|jgi:2-methylisocitrate lyase-like PEP mutase family enzyme|nr:isocitrate lyase/PEP mutase family protein [Beijerinckiaceae bacterium]